MDSISKFDEPHWKNFMATGSIIDYLKYKSDIGTTESLRNMCGETIENTYKGNSNKRNNFGK